MESPDCHRNTPYKQLSCQLIRRFQINAAHLAGKASNFNCGHLHALANGMTLTRTPSFALAFLLSVSLQALSPGQDAQPKPDNTKVNERDRNSGAATADKQKMNAADRELTAKIRKSVMADKSLSTYAHNVKIISQDGMVTLKGPVRSDEEVKSIVSKTVQIVGSADKVTNQMAVKP